MPMTKMTRMMRALRVKVREVTQNLMIVELLWKMRTTWNQNEVRFERCPPIILFILMNLSILFGIAKGWLHRALEELLS